ncbi:MAG: FG-GAP-like repeat-containing protein [Planktothrix sp. GU0601_MAG3]|nr:MAG: FG-GAP-like repeat-containing protein [Planktothrix sp. GU0601_MAG3]
MVSVAWSDYTGDGKPDLLLTGYSSSGSISKLYKNTGGGLSEDTSISLPGVFSSSVAWSDYNGDGKPDFLLTGWDSSFNPISKLYKNTGSGFSEDTSISLPGVGWSSVAWSDYTGDGKPDFLLTGYSSSGDISKLYKNTGSGFSEDTSISLPGVDSGSVAWSDYTGDGKPDFLLTGSDNSYNPISKLYKNTGSGFSEDTSISLPGIYYSSVAWSDYNGDGKPDLLLTGSDSSFNPISKLYKNTGSGLSEDTSISLPGVFSSSVAWSDYNGDGKPDLLLTGSDSSFNPISKLYKNTGSGLSEDTSISLPGVDSGSVAWSDYTGDGKPDFLLTGYSFSSPGPISKLYKNTTTPVINGTANNDILIGTANSETINGLGGNDKLSGLGGNDSLNGGTGNDTLNGGAGSDQLKGNGGNDVYIVGTGDIITELASAGTDLIQSSVTYTLPANVENLTLTGTTAINGTGNTLANMITGNTANNILNGGDGNDSLSGGAANDPLTGGLGADKFIYNTNAAFAASAVGVDTITDFTIGQVDKIVLDKTTFTSISSIPGTGFSIANEFAKVTTDALAATSAADIVYNTATGGLFYNPNGAAAGFGTGAKFLTLTGKPALTASQFLIQA